MRQRRGARRGGSPSRTWVSLNDGWALNHTATTATTLMSLQAPTTLTLTSDPPEDIVVDRIVGMFEVTLSAAASWTMALLVQDVTWTPSTFQADSDKRVLWTQTYSGASGVTWFPPGYGVSGALSPFSQEKAVMVDISPKVRIEPGRALYVVAYEDTGAATFTSTSRSVRLLFHRARRSR